MKIDKKKQYIAAVSGGPDSMALLSKYKKYIKIVCHVNYHKRVDSDHDQSIVEQYCKKNNIEFELYSVKKNEYINPIVNNFQMLARIIRYNFFVNVAKKYKIYDVLIAHNKNDFLETAYMQKTRRSKGFFYGINPISHYKNLTVYRPLIKIYKAKLEKYCQKHNIDYAIDSSNALDIYERNRIRKLINGWPNFKKNAFIREIKKHNKKMQKIQKASTHYFSKWRKSNFSIDYFLTIPENLWNHIVYILLRSYIPSVTKALKESMNINIDKINGIIQFVTSIRNNKTYYRITDNLSLLRHGDNLILKERKANER